MIVEPKVRGFICTTAHPKGCERHVKMQIDYVNSKGKFDGPKKVLVIGASTGFGLATRIAAAFGCGAATIGVSYEKTATDKRTATPGWYNTVAFEKFAKESGLYAKSLNNDAFSDELKAEVIDLIKKDLGKVDLVVYSLASPRRVDPKTKEVYQSTLKPTKTAYTNKTIDITTGEMTEITIEPANEQEIQGTIKVMGGEDWKLWIEALAKADVLEEGAITLAYSYIGPELTFPIYRDGTIGKAKEHLEATAFEITKEFEDIDLKAYVSVNKALVTQASSAIPVVPLYVTLLFKLMKEKGTHEGCIEQMYRMLKDKIYGGKVLVDEAGLIRMDDWEMDEEIQGKIKELWNNVSEENIREHADLEGFQTDFYRLFGFKFDDVDYSEDVEI